MALQSSGPISMNDMNIDRGIASGTQINLATAGTAYGVSYTTNGSDDLRFSEFYGLSVPTPTPPTAPTPSYHVWNLYRSAGEINPACSTTPAAQVIPYDSNYDIGLVFKGSNGFCYTIANDGFQVSVPNITVSEEFGPCTECTETVPPPSPPTPTPPSPPTPVVYYYNATRCDNSTNYIVYGGGNYYGTGVVVISGGTSYCYTIQNEVGVQAYDDTVGASVDNCNNASCYVATPPSPPTPPTLTMTVSQGCVDYAGTGTINITGVSNGSGNYVYHIGGSIDPDDPNAYNLNSSASGLANGNYFVAVYDSTNSVNVSETRNINCPPPPTPPSPPPTPPSPPPTPPSPPPTPPVCYTFNIINYDPNDTVNGTYTNCSGFTDYFSFTDTSGTSTVVGTICVQSGNVPIITSTGIGGGPNGAATNTLNVC